MTDDHLVLSRLLVASANRGREGRLLGDDHLRRPAGRRCRSRRMARVRRMARLAVRSSRAAFRPVLPLPVGLPLCSVPVALTGRALLRLTRRSARVPRRSTGARSVRIAGERRTREQRGCCTGGRSGAEHVPQSCHNPPPEFDAYYLIFGEMSLVRDNCAVLPAGL